MPRFEFHDEKSHKFWQIDRAGTEVVVQFGRIGTSGQRQQKSFPTEAAAVAHAAKLAAEKTAKGYVDTGAPTEVVIDEGVGDPVAEAEAQVVSDEVEAQEVAEAEPPAAAAPVTLPDVTLPDEDSWSIPESVRKHIYPRRGGIKTPPLIINPKTTESAAARIEAMRPTISEILSAAGTNPALLAAADQDPATPLGAAAVGVCALTKQNWQERAKSSYLGDAWVIWYGLEFAVYAAMETVDLVLAPDSSGHRQPAGPTYLRRREPQEEIGYLEPWTEVFGHLRSLLAVASDEDYRRIVDGLAKYRSGNRMQKVLCSFLAPTEQAWVDEDINELTQGPALRLDTLLLSSAATKDQLGRLAPVVQQWTLASNPQPLYSLLDGVGTDSADFIIGLADDEQSGSEDRRRRFGLIALIPTDHAFSLLVARADRRYVLPALVDAANRFPVRAVRLLAEGTRGTGSLAKVLVEVLKSHVAAHRDLVNAVRPKLPKETVEVLDGMAQEAPRLAEADLAALPAVLADPPWTRARSKKASITVPDLIAPFESRFVWRPGEEEAWIAGGVDRWRQSKRSWKAIADDIRNGKRVNGIEVAQFFSSGPLDLARPLAGQWRPDGYWSDLDLVRACVVRLGPEAGGVLALSAARADPRTFGELIHPLASSEIAPHAADWLVRLKTARGAAQHWLLRHPETAARSLIPSAVGKAGKDRTAAENALRRIADDGHRELVLTVAAAAYPAALAAVEQILDADPLEILPKKIPDLPEWLSPGALPQIRLAAGSLALPEPVVPQVITMLMISKLDEPYGGVQILRDACDGTSLAAFGRALLAQWQNSDYSTKDSWVLDAQGLIGDDQTARTLGPLIRVWPGEAAHARAVRGLDVLLAIGTDVSLMQLNSIAQRVKFKGLKDRAAERISDLAEQLGLSTEQLGDRLVPEFGLDADGSTTLDFGDKQFVVTFDEQLKPVLTDSNGTARKTLPKATTDLAVAETARFATLKKDIRSASVDQIRRLEQAMVTQRSWETTDFQTYLVRHPLVWHLARRLVWTAENGSFRLAEDRTFADLNDETFQPAGQIRLAHPLTLKDETSGWADLFADYEILQPFPQLGRETYTADGAAKFGGVTVTTGKVLGLERRGWQRSVALDAGMQGSMIRDLADGREISLDLNPGIYAGMATEFPEQTLSPIDLTDVDPISASEIVRDLESLL